MSALALYTNEHVYINCPKDARPTTLQNIRDQGLDGQLEGRTFVVTGGTSGLGYETARAVHATGADVYTTGRDASTG